MLNLKASLSLILVLFWHKVILRCQSLSLSTSNHGVFFVHSTATKRCVKRPKEQKLHKNWCCCTGEWRNRSRSFRETICPSCLRPSSWHWRQTTNSVRCRYLWLVPKSSKRTDKQSNSASADSCPWCVFLAPACSQCPFGSLQRSYRYSPWTKPTLLKPMKGLPQAYQTLLMTICTKMSENWTNHHPPLVSSWVCEYYPKSRPFLTG